MRTRARIAGGVLAAALLLAGCGYLWGEKGGNAPAAGDAQGGGGAATGRDEVYAGKDQKDQAMTLKVGQTLFVELKSIPTAGYVWNIKEQPAFLELAGETQRPTNPEVQNQPGYTGGNHYLGFRFKATAAGTGTLYLEEGRPWESDEPPIDTYSLAITVEP